MAIEAGARAGMVACDRDDDRLPAGPVVRAEGAAVRSRRRVWRTLTSDPNATFDRVVEIDAREIKPQVTWGTSPEMVTTIEGRVPDPDREKDPARREGMERALVYMGLRARHADHRHPLDKVFIGSCTNSRIEDLRARGWVVDGGKRVAGRQAGAGRAGLGLVKRQAEKEGLDKVFTAPASSGASRAARCAWR
jgi:3-isopropylmalate/(R)-2-methylmalate dehydratase large subunit